MKTYLLPFAFLGLTACAAVSLPTGIGQSFGGPATPGQPPAGAFPTGLANTCDGERFGPLVGQDATRLEKILFLGEVRIVRPETIVTDDYRPQRLNFDVSGGGKIRSIYCG